MASALKIIIDRLEIDYLKMWEADEEDDLQPEPIVTQPTADEDQRDSLVDDLMASPTKVPENIPSDLRYLASIDQLFVKEETTEKLKTHGIKNVQGQRIFIVIEDHEWYTHTSWCLLRPFDVGVFDNQKRKIIHLHSDSGSGYCYYPCCPLKLEVYSPLSNLIGTVEQTSNLLTPEFDIKDEHGTTVLKLKKRRCIFCIVSDFNFEILSLDESTVVGKISEELGPSLEDTNKFSITFPIDLDVRIKAVIIGACFLFLFMEEEESEEFDHALT